MKTLFNYSLTILDKDHLLKSVDRDILGIFKSRPVPYSSNCSV